MAEEKQTEYNNTDDNRRFLNKQDNLEKSAKRGRKGSITSIDKDQR